MNWEKVKLGDLLFESRIPAIEPNPDKRIRVKLNIQGVEKRPFENEINGATKQFIRKAGQFIYGKQNFHKGAFGIVPIELDGYETSADIPSFDVRSDCLAEWVFYYFKIGNKYLELEKIARGVGSKRIHPYQIAHLEIPLPSPEIQKKFIQRFKKVESFGQDYQSAINNQIDLMKLLRQQILQEAMQGKLTESWRNSEEGKKNKETGQQLLEKIKAEKAKLIKEGKLKKEKELPPIKPEEIPFEIPESWEWCRLRDLCIKIHYGFNAAAKPEKSNIRLLRITDIQNNHVDWETVPGCDYTESDVKNYLLKENDILIARTGGTIGKSYLVEHLPVKSLFASYLIRATPLYNISPRFLKGFLESPLYWKQLHDAAWGAGQPNVNGTSLSNLLIPLPPLNEQKRILAKIEQLVKQSDEMGKTVKQNQIYLQQLLQQGLRELLENKN